jgi:hypothetical protein
MRRSWQTLPEEPLTEKRSYAAETATFSKATV